jgi:hypothetical protein
LSPLLGWLAVNLSELSDDPGSTVNRLGPPPAGIEIGIIAAARDGKVSLENTHLAGETDHLIVPGRHTFIMYRRDVREQVLTFLQTGRFRR